MAQKTGTRFLTIQLFDDQALWWASTMRIYILLQKKGFFEEQFSRNLLQEKNWYTFCNYLNAWLQMIDCRCLFQIISIPRILSKPMDYKWYIVDAFTDYQHSVYSHQHKQRSLEIEILIQTNSDDNQQIS